MKPFGSAIAVIAAWLAAVSPAVGEAPRPTAGAPSNAVGTAPAAPPKLDPAEVEAWFDAQIIPNLKRSGVPGMVVVIVRRDGVVLSKGYGVSDVARATPVRADETLFETASIGKSMTALITEQLLEEGRIRLDEDVNHYLKSAQVTGPKVTLRMLLGHRGAFDDDLTGLFAPLNGDISMTRGELERRLRPVFPPDTQTGYDNQGFGLVALVLRDVTGEPIEKLYRERLFDPAGMTSAVQGRPADGDARTARCYVVHGPGKVRECEYWLYREGLRGAGGVSLTGDDMARYLRLLLGGGAVDGHRVLSERAFADLTDFSSYRFNPGLPGFARSFTQFESFRGLEYAHGGEIPGFNSIMKLYPDADVGIFVSLMGSQPSSFDFTPRALLQDLDDMKVDLDARGALFALEILNDSFAERFIPTVWPRRSEGPAAWRSSAPDEIGPYLGRYVLTGATRTRSIGVRLKGLFGSIAVTAAGPDSIRVMGLGPYRHVGPDLYEDAKRNRIAFLTTPNGRFMAFHLSPAQFRKTNAFDTPAWTLLVFPLSFLVILTALIQLRPGAVARLRRISLLSLAGLTLAVAGILAEWQWGVSFTVVKGTIFLAGIWRLALHIGAALLLAAPVLFFTWRAAPIGRISRMHGTLICVADLGVFVTLLFWRLLGAFPPWVSW